MCVSFQRDFQLILTMNTSKRSLSESSDPDDPDPGPGLGFTAVKRPRFSQESTEEDTDSAAASLDKTVDSSSSDTETGQVEAASVDKFGHYSSAAERMMAKMGYKTGSGLGKAGQGRAEARGKRG